MPDRATPSQVRTTSLSPKETNGDRYAHRTARVIEVIGASKQSFEDATRCAIADVAETLRDVHGAHVQGFSVKCRDGVVTEFKVDLKVAFGVERTEQP